MLGVVDTRIEREEKRVESGVSIGFLKRKGERRKKRRNFPRVKNSREFSLFVKAIDHSKRRVVFLTKATVIKTLLFRNGAHLDREENRMTKKSHVREYSRISIGTGQDSPHPPRVPTPQPVPGTIGGSSQTRCITKPTPSIPARSSLTRSNLRLINPRNWINGTANSALDAGCCTRPGHRISAK